MARVDLTLLSPPARTYPDLDVDALERGLTARVHGEVRFDAGTRGAYATDASNYRQVPIGVVIPLSVEAGAEAIAVCRAHGAPVLSRGGGTSLAGESTNVAVVLDWTKYCHRLVSVDPQARTCVVEPGSCSTISTPSSARMASSSGRGPPRTATARSAGGSATTPAVPPPSDRAAPTRTQAGTGRTARHLAEVLRGDS